MRKIAILLMVGMVLVISNTKAKAKTINEADTELCETLKMGLISSNRKPVDKAIIEIYKDDKKAQALGLSWTGFETELLKIKQVYGIGGLYEITLKVYPFYAAHNGYGEDEVVINTSGELISYKTLENISLNFN
ncbi:DUF3888 domain-containing protein [Peribacillus sp. NPDC058075]|uniref:DUF3888 domain-containing protein n=1 Tax=unclassified Peribacillus TaxID=2675266 RepID=UPI0036D8B5A3